MNKWWHEFKNPTNFRITPALAFPTRDLIAAALLSIPIKFWLESSLSPFSPPVDFALVDGVLIWFLIRGLFALAKVMGKR